MRRWSPHDEWAGHFRRYERADLEKLFDATGLQIVHLKTGLVHDRYSRSMLCRSVHAAGAEGGPAEISERTARSGVERSTEVRLWPLLSSFPGVMAMTFGMALQRMFLAELGDGYLAIGRRR